MTSAAAAVEPAGLTVDDTIRQTVRALRAARQADSLVMARMMGISRQSLYNRLNGVAPFLAAEIAGLAHFFGVPITDFYEGIVRVGVEATPSGTTERYPTAERRLVVVPPQVTDLSSCVAPTSIVPDGKTASAAAAVIRRGRPNVAGQCEIAA